MSNLEGTKRLERLLGYLRQDPHNASLLRESTELAMELGRGDEALAWLDQALASQPGDPALSGIRANVLIALSRFNDAAATLQGLMDRHGRDPVLVFNLAQVRLFQGHPADALDLLDTIPENDRGQLTDYQLVRARTAYQDLRYEDGLQSIDRFLQINPDHTDGLALKSMLLFDLERTQEAIDLAQRALQKNSTHWQAHLVLGSAALDVQDANAMERHFGIVVQQFPAAGRAWSGLGFSALIRREIPVARERFEKAVSQMTEHPGTWQGLAWTCIIQGELDRARQAIDRSLEVDRNFADNHGTLAIIDLLQERRTDAELSIRKALRLNPASPSALYAKALLQYSSGKSKSAEAMIETILGGMGGNGASLLKIFRESRKAPGAGIPWPVHPQKKLH